MGWLPITAPVCLHRYSPTAFSERCLRCNSPLRNASHSSESALPSSTLPGQATLACFGVLVCTASGSTVVGGVLFDFLLQVFFPFASQLFNCTEGISKRCRLHHRPLHFQMCTILTLSKPLWPGYSTRTTKARLEDKNTLRCPATSTATKLPTAVTRASKLRGQLNIR